jgi:Tryptophan-associated transmembrane protein (Trp_oprn_chp)
MEPAPAMNVSRPSALRLWGFVLAAVAALLAGIASALTWVTVGLRDQASVTSDIRGLDIVDGKIVLGAAVVIIVGVISTRLVAPSARTIVAAGVLLAAIVVLVVAAAFLLRASDRFEAVDSDVLVQKIAEATGEPVEAVRPRMEEVVAKLGGFTDLELGAWLALAGGVVGTVGGVLVVAWGRRTAVPEDEAIAEAEAVRDGPTEPTEPT